MTFTSFDIATGAQKEHDGLLRPAPNLARRLVHRFITWLLPRFTDFKVVAWSHGEIVGIGSDYETVRTFERWTAEAIEAMKVGKSAQYFDFER